MSIFVNVVNQKMSITSTFDNIVSGTQDFVKFRFNLSEDWDGLMPFVQFAQNGTAYNQYLDSDNCATLPSEIGAGTCTMMLYGSSGTKRATTNYLTLKINENILVQDAQSTEISQSLYDQLVAMVETVTSFNGQGIVDLQNSINDLRAQVNSKANITALTQENIRARAAEAENAQAIATKADAERVEELAERLENLEDNEFIAEAINDAVADELARYLLAGELANMTIQDNSITRNKMADDVEEALSKADSAMQPSVYDTMGLGIDVYAYARGRADTVQGNLDNLEAEITDAYGFQEGGRPYSNLKQALQGAVSSANTYTQAMLSEYEAFTIEVVNELPAVGQDRTFYLIPKESGNGYDKYWYITNNVGDKQWDVFGASSTEVVSELPATGDPDVDYILNSRNGCLYYKWINDAWKVVAGSLAYVSATLPSVENGNEYTDYYIVSQENGSYIHYRFINGQYRVIGGDAYNKSEINAMISALQNDVSRNESDIDENKTNISSLSQTLTSLQQTVSNLNTDGHSYEATYGQAEIDGTLTDNVFQLLEDGVVVSQFIIAGGGGGGGGGTTTTTTLTVGRITPSPLIITPTDPAIVKINFSSTDSEGETFDGTYTWKNGNSVLMTGALVQGENTFDLSEFVTVGTHKFSLTVVDEAGSMSVKSWTIQKVDVRLETTFSDRHTTAVGRNVSFSYIPYGVAAKTIHFKLDGVEDTVVTSASGTLQSYTIPAQPHGAHLLEVWATATVGSVEVETSHIFKDIIWYDEHGTNAVIGCIYRKDFYRDKDHFADEGYDGEIYLRQYDTLAIAHNVYDPTTSSPTVTRYVNGEPISEDKVISPQNVWNFKSDETGDYNLVIEVRNTRVEIKVVVTELGIDVSPVTANLEIDFNPTGITNSSSNRVWSNDRYAMSVSDNFDWANGGYKTDDNGDSYFLVKAGTRASFNYEMFAGGINDNPSVSGAEMKIVFMTENVQDANAVWFSNVDTTVTEVDGETQTTNVGIQMGVHEGWLKTNSASDTDIEGDDNTEAVAATNTYLYMPYSEEDIIEMDINIDSIDKDDPTAKAFVMAYEDGVPSKAFVYDNNDRFYQYTSKPIVIGSDSCDVRIYRLKIYSSALSTEDVMKNFIADSRDSTTMLARYDRNSIYYNQDTREYTPYSSGGVLDPEKLAPIIPNVKVLMLETDHFTTSKKTFVKSKLRCIHAPGGTVYPGDAYFDNWLFENGWHSGQGTTSDNYGNAGRNVDFLFNCDGVHKPSDKVNAEAGYISQVTLGYGSENATTEAVTDWKGDEGKVTLTRQSIPNNFFNLKVNIASSENVNNALLQKRYNDFLPYVSPAKQRDNRTKNDMEFVPAVLFLRETNEDIGTHNEFLDTNWHFYALGNIGDSKKTDYTRAYDPEDMNEFTIEISDNTKNNATFQSGVYMENGQRKVEAFTLDENNVPMSIAKPQSYVYPITIAEWNDPNNMRRWCLNNEDFDGDHSFEPRYACCGDYRDGKLVNDTSGRGKAQVELNNNVWRAFYRWVVTATDEEFVNELDQWCVRSAVEFFYAFTHYYTMMDNRAKNTFWHFAKTGVYREVSKPVPELLHVYCELINGEYVTTTDVAINNSKTYYTQYAFDLWDYDNDTAIGINNNGELIFPYGKEDIDFNIDGNAASGYVFNGATSVFWCRLRDLLPNEITSTFTSAVAECFSADNLIQQFDNFQECFPEEIWRLDIERKYIRTFTGDSVDNSKRKHDVQYLRDMMQGRKKYQRRQWMRDQEIYFGTMNLMNTVVGDNNRITFRCYDPGEEAVVPANYTISITPYQDMYVSAMFGNGDVRQVRAKAGVPYELNFRVSTSTDTQVTIYGANRIQALNDLSACYIAANNFSMATKLKKLVIGNPTAGYSNPRLTSLTLGSNKLLEELDIRNCGNLTGSINLAQCNNLLKLLAEGTNLTGVTFSTNGKVRIAHLPNSINTLEMRNLNDMVDFQANLSRLETLTLQGGTLDNKQIVSDCINTLRTLYLYDIDWTGADSLSDTDLLNAIKALFYSMLTGTVNVSGQIRSQEIVEYARKWNDLTVTYLPENVVPQHKITYVNDDADHTVLYEMYVDQGSTPPDIYSLGLIPKPTLPSDAQYTYDFGSTVDGEYQEGSGWDEIDSIVLQPRTVVANYTKTLRTYTVTWYARPGLSLGSITAGYGEEVVYTGEIPTNTSEESTFIFNVFAGWDKSTGFITEDTDVYAIWERSGLPETGKDLSEMTTGEIFAVTKSGRTTNYLTLKDYVDITLGHDFNFTNVESEVLAENLYLDGSTAIDKQITLFGENDESFTLAIDFQFTGTDTNSTLVSCFEENGSEGFRLRYNGSPDIQWGDVRQQFGNGKMRDIVVLRHRKGENKLYIYASNGTGTGTNFANSITRVELNRARSTTTNAIITLGAIRFIADGGHDDYGRGHIHWCKLWHGDLGDTNARQLAAWYHEPLRMEYYGSNVYRLAGGSSQKTNASFICNHLLEGRLQQMNTGNTNAGGWDASKMRTFLNTRILDAIPTVWRSMLKKAKISASAGSQSTEILISEDYIYLPCVREMNNESSSIYLSEGNYITWFTNNAKRCKFRGYVIPDNAEYYTSSSDPSTVTSNNVKPGDVWINTSSSSNGYIYVPQSVVDQYALAAVSGNLSAEIITASIGGAWVRTYWWWLRSPSVNNSTNFWNVTNNGGCSNYSASNSYGVCPCFSI